MNSAAACPLNFGSPSRRQSAAAPRLPPKIGGRGGRRVFYHHPQRTMTFAVSAQEPVDAFVPHPIAAKPPHPPPRTSRFLDPIKPLWTGFEYKAHQHTGIRWLQGREEAGLGGLVCDEMGLGKTIQLMALVKASAPRSNSLLIAPVAVLQQWADIAVKSNITVLRPGAKGWEIQSTYRLNAPKLYIIGYEMARNKHSLVITMDIVWDRLICDEAHRLGGKGSLYSLVDRVPSPIKWLLTATPIVNGMKDFENLLRLCGVPSKNLGSFETLKPVIKETVLARTMEQLRAAIPDAPPKPELQTIDLPFQTEEEGEFYRGMAGVIVKRWKALDSDGGSALAKLQLFVRLRQLSLHPQVYISARRKALGAFYARPDWTGSSTKFETIKQLVSAPDSKPHKWIVFCHFYSEMELLEEMLQAEPTVRNVHLYNGTLSAEERKRVLEETLDPVPEGKADVLLIQLQSGGVGLNLQHFDRIIFSGPWWTSALMEQAIGRAVRIGQREVVKVYHLRLEEEEAINIDSVMMDKAAAKGELCKAVLECAEHVC